MGKNPAVLWYSSDYLSGTLLFTWEQKGQYAELLSQQHQLYPQHFPENHMISICGSLDSPVIKKFIRDENGLYYNKRMEEECIKRINFCNSRSNNKSGRKPKESHDLSYDNHKITHMGNENDNENRIINDTENTGEECEKGKQKPVKHRYGEYNHVLLTDYQFQKLTSDFGEKKRDEMIKKLDEGIQMKGYKYTDHNLAMRNWERREGKSTNVNQAPQQELRRRMT